MKEKIVLIGGGGHCKVVIDAILKADQYEIAGITDQDPSKKEVLGVPIIGPDEMLSELYLQGIGNAIITLGSTGYNSHRKRLFQYASSIGFKMLNVIHPMTTVGLDVKIGLGNCLMAGAIINSSVIIRDNCIVNTGVIIEHDCIIESHVHISPGATLGGGVKIGMGVHIGLGAKLLQGVHIGNGSIIGAGSVVVDDISSNSVVVGVPGKVIKKTKGE